MLVIRVVLRVFQLGLLAAVGLAAATLQKLSLEEMSAKSTEVVRGRVTDCAAAYRGRLIYTTCKVSVSERWKGSGGATVEVSVPGGAVGGVRQVFAGAPALARGDEHVFFLWTGRSGVTQVMGLSQGLLSIEQTPGGPTMAVRGPVRDRMLDADGKPVWDEGVDVPLEALRAKVTGARR